MADQEPVIKLADGTELVPLTKEDKEKLEAEIQVVLKKYDASYLPVIQEDKSITHTTQRAGLLILKKKTKIKVGSGV